MTSILQQRKSLHRKLQINEKQLRQLNDKMDNLANLATMGTATSMIAHEINNILTPVGNYAQLALRNLDDKQLVEKALRRCFENCQKAAKVSEAILTMVNGSNGQKKDISVQTLFEDVFACLCRDFKKDGIMVNMDIEDGLTVWAEAVKLQQALMNIILNARYTLLETNGGSLDIKAWRCGEIVNIQISDTGCGMDEKTLDRIFDPFFTTKNSSHDDSHRAGSGLGLAFCQKVVDEHEGKITAESELGMGSKFLISLPGK